MKSCRLGGDAIEKEPNDERAKGHLPHRLVESVAYRSLQERVVQVGKPDAQCTLQAKCESQVIGSLEGLSAQD